MEAPSPQRESRWDNWIPWPFPAAGLVLLLVISLVGPLKSFLVSQRHGDFIYFYQAAEAMRHGQDIYEASGRDYIYPPLLAFLFQPLSYLPLRAAATVWLLSSAGLIVAALLLAIREFFTRFDVPFNKTTLLAAALLAGVVLFDKLHGEFGLGQTDVLLLLSYALALRWLDRRPLLAGVVIGFAANIKYLPLIFLPYFLLRGRFRSAAATVVSFGVFLFLPALSTGLTANLHQVRMALGGLTHMARVDAAGGAATLPAPAPAANIAGIAWERSISITSALARLCDHWGLPVQWATAGVGGVLVLLTLLVWRMYRRRGIALWYRPRDADGAQRGSTAVEWAALAILALVLSPQTTTRHMVLLLPAVALAGFLLVMPRRGVPRVALLAALVVLLLGLILPPPHSSWMAPWRDIGGASWCSLLLLVALVHAGLYAAGGGESNGRPGNDAKNIRQTPGTTATP